MELLQFSVPKSLERLVIAPLGDFQWSGDNGPTAQGHLQRHIDQCLERNAFFVGTGDYIDFLSPSNRKRLASADLYDTAVAVIAEKARELNEQVFEKFLKPTVGRWLGIVEGHHFFEAGGETSDIWLADKLKTTFLGTSAFVRIPSADFTLYVHHGSGGGVLPGSGLNRMYHLAAGLQGAEVYLMGHNTKLMTARLSRPFPVWGKKQADHHLEHRDVWLVNCGGFSRSNQVRNRINGIPRGDYPEQGLMTPSPLAAPIITVDLKGPREHRTRVTI